MHTAFIFKEQTRVNGIRETEKGLSQPHYSRQHIEGYDLLCYKNNYFYIDFQKSYQLKSEIFKRPPSHLDFVSKFFVEDALVTTKGTNNSFKNMMNLANFRGSKS
jgi:hypothetical protein